MNFRKKVCGAALRCITGGTILLAATAPSVKAQETAAYECVNRPEDVHPPPFSLPSLRRAPRVNRDHDRNSPGDVEQDQDKESDKNKETSQKAATTLHFKPVCPEGKVPVTKTAPYRGPKGNPLFASDPTGAIFKSRDRAEFVRKHVRRFEEVYQTRGHDRFETGPNPPPKPPAPDDPPCDGTLWYGACFYYGSAGFPRVADGAGMTQSVEKPVYVNVDGSTTAGHTLDEIAVMDSPTIFNTVELGWFVSKDVYGDDDPHIFVYHWIRAAETCYDDCGWQQYSSTYFPRMNLGSAVGKDVYIGYVYYQSNWWAWFDDQWMGYFPGSLWGGAFTKTALIQWFGEVSSLNGIPPQTQMGNGQFPIVSSAGRMTTLCDVDAKAWICWYRDRQGLAQTPPNPKDYNIQRTGWGATRYGGPGR